MKSPTFGLSALALIFSLTLACTPEPDENEELQTRAFVGASLPGSKFEIDADSNLKLDCEGDCEDQEDWATVAQVSWPDEGEWRQNDMPSGKSDNSYKSGAKEDTECPSVGFGSIPPNKSDLDKLSVYVEKVSGGPGFLHLLWTRVQDPSGTTNIDFELNQNETNCGADNPHKIRTPGDVLVQYELPAGSTQALISLREWEGTQWGPPTDLTATQQAAGTINTTAIDAADADGLGPLDPRTLGEASIDLAAIFGTAESCVSFGSVFAKSRSSDEFNSVMKDYTDPLAVNISNCGRVTITKVTEPAGLEDLFEFTHTMNLADNPDTTFYLKDGESEEFSDILFNGDGETYTVTENVPPGFELTGIECTGASVVSTDGMAEFTIQSDTDNVACTFTNTKNGTIIIKKVSTGETGTFDFTSTGGLVPSAFSLTTTAEGEAGADSRTFSDLSPGIYGVSEIVPEGWDLTSVECDDDNSDPQLGGIVLDAGETVTCTFTNARQTGALMVVNKRYHAAEGPGLHAHGNVDFALEGNNVTGTSTVDENGVLCIDGILPGMYSATELIPAGYMPLTPLQQEIEVSEPATCGSGNEAVLTFKNMPLTDITVEVNSHIDGGTYSTITCGDQSTVIQGNGDGSLALPALPASSASCTIEITFE